MNQVLTKTEMVVAAIAVALYATGIIPRDIGLGFVLLVAVGYTIFCGISVLHWLLKPRQ